MPPGVTQLWRASAQNKTPQTQFESWDVCRSALPQVLLKKKHRCCRESGEWPKRAMPLHHLGGRVFSRLLYDSDAPTPVLPDGPSPNYSFGKDLVFGGGRVRGRRTYPFILQTV